jgi:predicted  nucleic acid-binding Zn-ribbon protein
MKADDSKQHIGFIAHELQEVFPQLVDGEKDGEKMQSINVSGLIPILVKEIQDLKKLAKQLMDNMAQLMSDNIKLKSDNIELKSDTVELKSDNVELKSKVAELEFTRCLCNRVSEI